MYTRAATVEMREKVLWSICDPKSTLCIVLATSAFGMGIICQDTIKLFVRALTLALRCILKSQVEPGGTIYLQLLKFVKADVKEYKH